MPLLLVGAVVGAVGTYYVSDTVQNATKWLVVGGVVIGAVMYGPKLMKAMQS